MQRLFGAFPGGWQGAALFLLRTVVGGTAVFEGVSVVRDHYAVPFEWIVCLVMVGAGLATAVGAFTPISNALIVIMNCVLAVSSFGLTASEFSKDKLATFYVVIMAATAMFLGPGAFSLDARMFGRREIVIPRATRSEKP